MAKILFWAPYPPGQAPSQRFRFEHYLGLLAEAGHSYAYESFWDEAAWQALYQKGRLGAKIGGLIRGYWRRCLGLWRARHYDWIYLHREAAPLGPPLFEWILTKILRKKLIFDYDDAIWLPNTSSQNRLAAGLKWHQKTVSICAWAHKVSAGNAYLGQYAQGQGAKQVHIIPTVVETQDRHNRLQSQENTKPALGWTGSHSTLIYLEALRPVLETLAQELDFEFVLICNQPPAQPFPKMRFVPWSAETEVEDLLRFHLGLMPLEADAWAEGKCGFKAIQYMALGIPALVSPVGVNAQVVRHQVDGWHCVKPEDWLGALRQLLRDAPLRQRLGYEARARIEAHYSVQATQAAFLKLFEEETL